MRVQFGNMENKALFDSGGVCTTIHNSPANALVLSNKDSCYWRKPSGLQDLKAFPNDLIKIVSVIKITVKCGKWLDKEVRVTVVEDGHRSIIGRDLFLYLCFSVTQSRQVLNIDQNRCPIKQRIALDFRGLISRISKSHKHTVKSTGHKSLTPTHQKGRRIPINLQPVVKSFVPRFCHTYQ